MKDKKRRACSGRVSQSQRPTCREKLAETWAETNGKIYTGGRTWMDRPSPTVDSAQLRNEDVLTRGKRQKITDDWTALDNYLQASRHFPPLGRERDEPKMELGNYEPDATKNIRATLLGTTIIEPGCAHTRSRGRESRPARANDHRYTSYDITYAEHLAKSDNETDAAHVNGNSRLAVEPKQCERCELHLGRDGRKHSSAAVMKRILRLRHLRKRRRLNGLSTTGYEQIQHSSRSNSVEAHLQLIDDLFQIVQSSKTYSTTWTIVSRRAGLTVPHICGKKKPRAPPSGGSFVFLPSVTALWKPSSATAQPAGYPGTPREPGCKDGKTKQSWLYFMRGAQLPRPSASKLFSKVTTWQSLGIPLMDYALVEISRNQHAISSNSDGRETRGEKALRTVRGDWTLGDRRAGRIEEEEEKRKKEKDSFKNIDLASVLAVKFSKRI
ncbi:hypothetical protein WN51_12702 [Melipona quadrifasciata]|uniref:Uncharacterized protein n=1 Tax=Melipona quadrifasciata TaxID=166423 RepID=A0A0M9A133_9HYME|nr:hypothetical protein WN51_12702 [Melipona quadrifasciata]